MGTLNLELLKEFKEKYNTPIFFETGTAWGEGVKTALKCGFKQIISVEIMEPQYNILKDMFKTETTVNLICTNSIAAMQQLLPTTKKNIFYWLDAHYPNADLIQNDIRAKIQAYMDGDDTIRLPLEDELTLIKSLRPNNKDVIMIDDLNIYNNDISPEAYWLKPKKTFQKFFYKEIFKDTHNFLDINGVSGVLLPND